MRKTFFLISFALLLRLAMVSLWHGTGREVRLSDDATDYYQIAENLAAGRGFFLYGLPTSRRVPLYPLMLALDLKGGQFPLGTHLAQAVLGAFSCLILFSIGRNLGGEGVGLLAGGLLASDYLSVRQTVSCLPETVFVFFLLLSFWSLLRAAGGGSRYQILSAGIFAGLATLTKETFSLYFLLVVPLCIFLQEKKKKASFGKSVLFLSCFVITLLPWLARNLRLHGKPVYLTLSAGHTFYLGNNPGVKGRIAAGDWTYQKDSEFPPNDPALPPLLTPEADRYLMEKGLEFVRNHPDRFLALGLKKFLRFWFPYYPGSPLLTKGVVTVQYFLILGFAVWGMIRFRKQWRRLSPVFLLMIYAVLIHSVTISSLRYRYPLMPFLMVFAAAGGCELWARRRRKAAPAAAPAGETVLKGFA